MQIGSRGAVHVVVYQHAAAVDTVEFDVSLIIKFN